MLVRPLKAPVYHENIPGIYGRKYRITVDSDRKEHALLVNRLADEVLSHIQETLPSDRHYRAFLLLEMQRGLDLSFLLLQASPNSQALSRRHSTLSWGMNLATSELLSLMPEFGIAIEKSSIQTQAYAGSLLWQFGIVTLLRRSAEMVRLGLVVLGEGKNGDLTFEYAESLSLHLLDILDESVWRQLDAHWAAKAAQQRGWKVVPSGASRDTVDSLKSYWQDSRSIAEPSWDSEEIFQIMRSLVDLWETPYGEFVQYGADRKVDEFFITRADSYLESVFPDAGIHPSTDFGGFNGADLLTVLVMLISLYEKHARFCLIANDKFPNLDLPACLTLWEPKTRLIDALAEMTNPDASIVHRVVECLSVSAADHDRLSLEITAVRPMIIDLGNGMVVRPLSSLHASPLSQFKIISGWRNPSSTNQISKNREKWLRMDLYSLFGGNRYICIDGAIVIRRNGRLLTDIDAAIFDKATGDVALFQLKWQDYDTDSLRQRASRAKNFSEEVDHWGNTVGDWMSEEGLTGIAQAMRLNLKRGEIPRAAFVFALSRNFARTQAYGYSIKSPWVSVATLAQLRRLRSHLGPGRRVFSSLHELLREEENWPIPTQSKDNHVVKLWDGRTLLFDGIWQDHDSHHSH